MAKFELTADAPCPALTGAPWDVCFELHGHKVPRYIGIWVYWSMLSFMKWALHCELSCDFHVHLCVISSWNLSCQLL